MKSAKKNRKQLKTQVRVKRIRVNPQQPKPKEFEWPPAGDHIMRNALPPDSLTKLLENFSMVDLIDLLEVAGYPEPLYTGTSEEILTAWINRVPERLVHDALVDLPDGRDPTRFRPLAESVDALPNEVARVTCRTFLWTLLGTVYSAISEAVKGRPVWFFVGLPYWKRWKTNTANDTLEPAPLIDNPLVRLYERIERLFDQAKPSRFRRCAYERCNRRFYATRADRRCCSKRCANNLAQREWYREHSVEAKLRKDERQQAKRQEAK